MLFINYIYNNVTKITCLPAVSITLEEAELFHRLTKRGAHQINLIYLK
jgi:hypothetical protein